MLVPLVPQANSHDNAASAAAQPLSNLQDHLSQRPGSLRHLDGLATLVVTACVAAACHAAANRVVSQRTAGHGQAPDVSAAEILTFMMKVHFCRTDNLPFRQCHVDKSQDLHRGSS